MELAEISYMCANVVAAAKEKAIMEAFNFYFSRKDWTEEDIALLELSMVVDLSEQKETMYINKRAMVEFSLMNCHIDVETSMVQCLYHQDIKVLYGCCGVGA